MRSRSCGWKRERPKADTRHGSHLQTPVNSLLPEPDSHQILSSLSVPCLCGIYGRFFMVWKVTQWEWSVCSDGDMGPDTDA